MTKRRGRPACPYCGKPANETGACGSHQDLLELEPDVLARQVDAIAELEEQLVNRPGARRRRPKGS